MQTIADGVILLPLAPRFGLNAYLIDDTVLVDTGMPFHHGRIRRLLEGRRLDRIVLTHAHIDHAGTVAHTSADHGAEVLCGAADLADLAAGVSPPIRLGQPLNPVQRAIVRYRPIRAVELKDGAEVGGGFVAVATRGHTPGHMSLWRESDRVLIAGDALFGVSTRLRTGVFPPPKVDQPDPESCRRSIQRLAELRPEIIAFGHGPPLVLDAAHQLSALNAALR
ncbi:MAG: MBL fold metallo-hydrolase [Solirubrobacteraceae bacterium]|nr:MBL fold metallo-hydrolase [Solirubrobacteraceae bacterium]